MTIYVAAFICGGPWLGSGSTAHRNFPQIGIAVLLAALAARGSRSARVLMITYSAFGAFAVFASSTYWGASEPLAASFVTLTCVVVQLGLLVSAPMYERTRPGWVSDQLQADRLWPWPKLWAAMASAAGGLVMATLPFSDGYRNTACSEGAIAHVTQCSAFGYGYPVAYRFAYNDLAPRGIVIAAFAADWALWSLSIFLVLYLLQVSRSRKTSELGMPPAGQPAVIRP
jgi:hypothetical protein